jgi:hypothetical protein
MTVRASIDRLGADLVALGEALELLSRRAVDSPPDNAVPLAQGLADTADTMAGWAAEARESLSDSPSERVATRLVGAHRFTLRIARDVAAWTSYERMADVVAAGQEGGRPGHDWCLDVRDALDGCRVRLARVERQILASWQELAEAELTSGVSVHAISVGPQVSFAGEGPAPRRASPQANGGETDAGQ